MSRRQARLP